MMARHLELEAQIGKISDRRNKWYCFPGCDVSYIQIPFAPLFGSKSSIFLISTHKMKPPEFTVSLKGDLANWVSSFPLAGFMFLLSSFK